MAGVMAAPNSTRIHASIKAIDHDKDLPDKTLLTLKINSLENLFGPCFFKSGDIIDAFTFERVAAHQTGDDIDAEIEYIGGATSGTFQITRIIN